jgi:hypothetical protein
MNGLMLAFIVILGGVSLVLAVAVGCALVLSGRISRHDENRYDN